MQSVMLNACPKFAKPLILAGLLALLVAMPAPAAENCPLCAMSASQGGDEPAATPDATADTGAASAILQRAEAAAKALDTLTARLRFATVQGLLGDEQVRFGTLAYDAGVAAGHDADQPVRPPRFDIRLDRLLVDGKPRSIDKRYVFDGRWLAEIDHDEKVFTRRELVAEGEQARFMELGEGPFALPLNMDADVVHQRFVVESLDADAPTLRLTPRDGFDLDLDEVTLVYDRDTMLPASATTLDDAQAGDVSTLRLMDTQTGVALDGTAFDTTPPAGEGWRVQIVELDDTDPS